MGLSMEQASHALGIAEYFAPNAPMMRDVDHPAMVKHGIGWGAMTGIMAAELASLGYTGIPCISGFEKYRHWVEDIGENYLLVGGITWKSQDNACCAWAHAAMKGARRLADDHSVRPEDIERILVEGFSETVRLGTKLPSTTEEAQFNVSWPVAAMLVDGEVGPRQMLEDRLGDPVVKALAQKVELVECEDLNELHKLFKIGDDRGQFAGRVTLELKDGRKLESGLVDAGQRFPQTDWNERTIEDKFRHLAGFVIEDNIRIDRIIESIWRFEQMGDMAAFVSLLIPTRG
jgi:2-methylcitrate dehydratase PrpD